MIFFFNTSLHDVVSLLPSALMWPAAKVHYNYPYNLPLCQPPPAALLSTVERTTNQNGGSPSVLVYTQAVSGIDFVLLPANNEKRAAQDRK